MLGYPASYWGLLASGILILVSLIYLIYIVFVRKIKFSPELILVMLLLFTIAIGIHSLQHEGQEVYYDVQM